MKRNLRPLMRRLRLIAFLCVPLILGARTDSTPAAGAPDGPRHFDSEIAPLLARHCLECHGPNQQKGRLDLSRKDTAFAGGKSGKAIVPGNLAESLLWTQVESDEMPDDNPPLSAREKELLRQWIERGAVWSADANAPLAHLPDRRAGRHILRRLTVTEYIETVRSATGVNVEHEAQRILPRDLRADGFSNTAYNLNVDLGHVAAYAELAEIIVERMDMPAFVAGHAKCQELSESCLREVIAGIGPRLFRGPLDEHEMTSFLRISSAVAEEGGDFAEAVGCIVEAMLQSPRFIYRIENERGDGAPRPLGPYELASRLSYILWGAPPDDELMRAAEAGKLSNHRAIESQVQRMLQDPRAVERSAQFIDEWLNLARLENLRPNKQRFPKWNPDLAGDMRAETRAFFQEVVWEQNRPLSDLMNAPFTYATPRLAAHYGLDQGKPGAAANVPPALALPDFRSRRNREGLQALYRFDEAGGDVIRDTSGGSEPLDLKIADLSAVEWGEGQLRVKGTTLIATAKPATRLIDAVRSSNAFTVEAWVTPENASQTGPARIVTLSSGSSRRNFTLGQDGNRYDVRFRTTKRDANGMPGVSSPQRSVETRPTHLVYTRDVTGRGQLYIHGEQKAAYDPDGDLSNWDAGFHLGLANESTRDRPWRGTLHLVAIYNRALDADEIRSRGEGLSRYELASVAGRGGLLTQGSALTVGGDEASMVARGLFVLRNFLWGTVDDPPPCVDTTPVPTKPGLSQRAIAEARLANRACGSCHSSFEPLAFGLEKFDGLGARHDVDEHGNKLRDDGEILIPGAEKPVAYKSAAELMDLLAGSGRVQKGVTRKLAQFALGRPLVLEDAPTIDRIHESAWKGGGTYTDLITAIALSDLVQTIQTENP